MHQVVQSKPEEYLEKDPHLESFFDKLIKAGKKLFLVTNSPFNFVWVLLKKDKNFLLLIQTIFNYRLFYNN